MSEDKDKKYTFTAEIVAFSYREMLSRLVDILSDIDNYEYIIVEKGFTSAGVGRFGSKTKFDVIVEPWEVK